MKNSTRKTNGRGLNPATVIEAFRAKGYAVFSGPSNSKEKIEYACPKGHRHSMNWNNFQQGKRCPSCYCKESRGSNDLIAKMFADEGYHLTSQYQNAKQKLDYICPKGHHGAILVRNFKKGNRCPICFVDTLRTPPETVEAAFTAEGYKLKDTYTEANSKLGYICPEGHHHSITWGHFVSGKRCPYCKGRPPWAHEDIKPRFEAEGYRLMSLYVRAIDQLDYICPKGHHGSMNWANFQSGRRCPSCAIFGYKKSIPGRLYYVRFDFPNGLSLYKIGITNRTISHRFADEPTPYTVLLDLRYKDGTIPPKEERRILTRHAKYKYKGPNRLVSGNTECFTRDVLKLDAAVVQLPLPICGAA